MQKQIIETNELELKKLYLKVRKDRMTSDINYSKKTTIIWLDIYKKNNKWHFNFRKKL